MAKFRLTVKHSGGRRLMTRHVELDAALSEAQFVSAFDAAAAAIQSPPKTASRPGDLKRNKTASRSKA